MRRAKEAERACMEAGLQSSLATINVISENYGQQLHSLPSEEAEALRNTLNDIATTARALKERLDDEDGRNDESSSDSRIERATPETHDPGESSSLLDEGQDNATAQETPLSSPAASATANGSNSNATTSSDVPRRKLSQPFIAPLVDMRRAHDIGESDIGEPPPPLLPPPDPDPHPSSAIISPGIAAEANVSASTSPTRDRIRTLVSNAAPKLGARVSKAVSNAIAIHPSNKTDARPSSHETNSSSETEKEAEAVATGSKNAISRPRRPLLSGRRKEADWIEAARDAFRIIDVNRDGFLQKEEVVRAITTMQDENSSMQLENPTEMADRMMAEVDTDGDGQIDMDEFVEMMRKGQVTQGSALGEVSSGQTFSYNHRMSQLARNVLLAHQKKLENSIIGDDLWMIHPLSNIHAIWDVLVSLLILLTVITMPLSIGWDELNDAFFAMNLTVDFIFLLDVCKNFCTGFVDENEAVIMDAKVVRRNYLTGFFITDLCSSLPLDLILRAAGASDTGAVTGTKQSLKMLKLLRMAKLFRLLRISRLFKHIKEVSLYLEERLNFRISDGFTKLLRLGIGALVLGHWIGCFNFMLVRLHDFPEDSWVVYAGLDDQDAYTQWSWSFFKALAQMIMIGFETPPFTNASCDTLSHWCGIEHWITLLCLYLGAVFYSLLISSISSVLQTASLASRQFEEKLTVIDDYMRSKKLPAAMREKVKDYFHLQHSNGKLYNETEILDMVTPILRREIKQFNGRDITTKVPIFSSVANKEFAEEMTTAIEPTIAFNDEVIMREKTTGDEMYFINSGVVEIFVAAAKNSAYVAIGDGCFFGEVSLLLGTQRTASARTKTQCMLYKISKKRLLSVLEDFPEMAERMKRVAESRVRRLEHYLDPANKPLRKEDEVDAEDSKTDLFGADADVVARDKAEEFQKASNPTFGRVGGVRTTALYSPMKRRQAHQGHQGGQRPKQASVLPLTH